MSDQQGAETVSYKGPHIGNLMDSRLSHLDDLLKSRLEEALHYETSTVRTSHIAKIASEHEPVDLAYAVSRLPSDARPLIFNNLPDWQAKVDFFINTDPNTRAIIYRRMSDKDIRGLIEKTPLDETVEVLDNLPGYRLRKLLESLDAERANCIRQRQECDRHSAGWMMIDEFFSFTPDVTIEEAAAAIRKYPGIDLSQTIFVVSEAGELRGYVQARNLIVNRREMRLEQVMQQILHQVKPEATRDEVVDIVERYKMPVVPVVDHEDHLMGVITYEAVVEAMEDMTDETLAQVAGTLEKVDSYDPIVKRFFARAPWLVFTLCCGLVNATSISYFEGLMSPWLAFVLCFIPLITGMSGNVGVQCSTVLVRGMAIGTLSSGSKWQTLMKEVAIGTLSGLVFGLLCGSAVYLLNALGVQQMGGNPIAVACIVSAGLFGACMTATFLGVFSPVFFARIGIDPAVSSGPIVTAFNDVLSMLMYFAIAQTIGFALFS